MRINFYDTRVEECRTVLVKEKSVNYRIDDISRLCLVAELMNPVASLNVMGEEHCYILALNDTRSDVTLDIYTTVTKELKQREFGNFEEKMRNQKLMLKGDIEESE